MGLNIKRILVGFSGAIITVTLMLVGCNTVQGVGKDISSAGHAISGSSTKANPAPTTYTTKKTTVYTAKQPVAGTGTATTTQTTNTSTTSQ